MHARAKITAKKPESKSNNPVSYTKASNLSQSMNSPVDHILHIQRTIGNQAVQRLFKSGVIQAKLRIAETGNIYEQEANRVAEQVMRMTIGSNGNTIQKQEEETVQPKPT